MGRVIRESVLLGEQEITIETGRMAKQAGGSALIQYGDTIVLVTACGGREKGLPFFPLVCDYVEKTYAAGRIPGSYFRREGRLGEKETLTSRLIDRPVRPLFPEGYRKEVQVIATVLSFDQQNDADVLAITGASTALMLSDLPWAGPVAGVRLGRVKGQWIANPTFDQRELSDSNLILVASEDAILMVEGETDGLTEGEFLEAMDFGMKSVADVLKLQHQLARAVGKTKQEFVSPEVNEELVGLISKKFGKDLDDTLRIADKLDRYARLDGLKAEVIEAIGEEYEASDISDAYGHLKYTSMRSMILDGGIRIDGRRFDQVRPITCELGVLPRVHGSALFTRGETQALVTMTVATQGSDQRIEELTGMRSKRFMLHYNFPPFSVGETRPLRGPGRREIGHGMLAERALTPMLPTTDEDYPYVLRIVSEILESNGSSSMATVCGGTLAAIDAGLEVQAPVAGIAMGLVKEGEKAAVLSDILGDEDHLGDMDFKVCGTRDQITAIQMDVKIAGISRELMKKALHQARKGRLHILDRMMAAVELGEQNMSPYAPRIVTMQVNPGKIRDIIGAGGKTIRGIQTQTNCKISVEDDGTVTVASNVEAELEQALAIIRGLTREPRPGEVYLGTCRRILDFGAIVELFPGADGLCHISELTEGRVEKVTDVIKEGDEVLVKVLGVERGKIRLSRKAAIGLKPTPLS